MCIATQWHDEDPSNRYRVLPPLFLRVSATRFRNARTLSMLNSGSWSRLPNIWLPGMLASRGKRESLASRRRRQLVPFRYLEIFKMENGMHSIFENAKERKKNRLSVSGLSSFLCPWKAIKRKCASVKQPQREQDVLPTKPIIKKRESSQLPRLSPLYAHSTLKRIFRVPPNNLTYHHLK